MFATDRTYNKLFLTKQKRQEKNLQHIIFPPHCICLCIVFYSGQNQVPGGTPEISRRDCHVFCKSYKPKTP